MAIILERNEIISPKSAHLCTGSVCDRAKKGAATRPLGCAVSKKKKRILICREQPNMHENSYSWATVSLIEWSEVCEKFKQNCPSGGQTFHRHLKHLGMIVPIPCLQCH